MKELTNVFEGTLASFWENIKKKKIFPIEKEVAQIDKFGNENLVTKLVKYIFITKSC